MSDHPHAFQERAVLRERIIEVESKVFLQEGYEKLSIRRVVQEADCSQMAMHRHFENKEKLTQYLCGLLYKSWVAKMNRAMDRVTGPREKLHVFVKTQINFVASYPDHYALVFLVKQPNAEVCCEREELGQRFVAGIYEIVRGLLPVETSSAFANKRLGQMFSCLHGTASLLIAHVKVHGLTKPKAAGDAWGTIPCLLGCPDL